MAGQVRGGGPALVGRGAEMAAVRAAIVRAHAGEGSPLTLVLGPRGAGKSLLLEAVAAEARYRSEALVFSARAEPLRRGQGFGVLCELLRAAIGVPAGGDAEEARRALLAWCARNAPGLVEDDALCLGYLIGVVDHAEPAIEITDGDPRRIRDATWAAATHLVAAAAAERPALILVDDLDLADDASVELLAHLARRLAEARLCVVGAARPDRLAARPGLSAIAGDTAWTRVELGPLGAEALRAVAEAGARRTLGDREAAAVVEAAGSNPLLALELGRIAAARPGDAEALRASGWTPERAVEAQLPALPEGARAALAASAVLGEKVWEGALAAMGVRDAAAALRELSARGLAAACPTARFAGEREWAVRPRVWAEEAGRALDTGEAAAAHLAAGRWLRARREEPAIVGEHLAAGGAGEEAAAALEAAASAAERAGALAAAQALAFRAAALGEGGAARVRRRLLGVRQGVTSATSREALRAEAEALLAEAQDDALGRVAVCWTGNALFLLGATDHAHLARVAEAARRAAAVGEADTAAWGLKHASFALSVTGRQAEAEALIRDITERLGDLEPGAAAAVAHARGILLMSQGRTMDAAEELGVAFDLASAANHRSVAVENGSDYAYLLLVAGDLEGCLDVLEHAYEMAEETGSGHDQILQNVVEHAMWTGPHRRQDAPLTRRAFARARAVREDDLSRYGLCLRGGLLVFSAAWPDDPRALPAAEVLGRSGAVLAAAEEAGFWELASEVEGAAALALLRLGRPEEAMARAEAAVQKGSKLDLAIYPTQAELAAHDAARALGRAEAARAALERAAALVQREIDRRAGTRYARLFLEGYAMHRRLLAACAEMGVPAPGVRNRSAGGHLKA